MSKYIIGMKSRNGMPTQMLTGKYGITPEGEALTGYPFWEVTNDIKKAKTYDSIDEIQADEMTSLERFWNDNIVFEIKALNESDYKNTK